MKKICIVCESVFNDWFMQLLGWLFQDKHDYKSCQSCRDLCASGWSVTDIRDLKREVEE